MRARARVTVYVIIVRVGADGSLKREEAEYLARRIQRESRANAIVE